MTISNKESMNLNELIAQLNADRALILEMIDKGSWPKLRHDLAALEREMGQLLTRASEKLEEDTNKPK